MQVSHFSMDKSISKTRMLEFSTDYTQKKCTRIAPDSIKEAGNVLFVEYIYISYYFFCQTVAKDDKLVWTSNKKLIIKYKHFSLSFTCTI